MIFSTRTLHLRNISYSTRKHFIFIISKFTARCWENYSLSKWNSLELLSFDFSQDVCIAHQWRESEAILSHHCFHQSSRVFEITFSHLGFPAFWVENIISLFPWHGDDDFVCGLLMWAIELWVGLFLRSILMNHLRKDIKVWID